MEIQLRYLPIEISRYISHLYPTHLLMECGLDFQVKISSNLRRQVGISCSCTKHLVSASVFSCMYPMYYTQRFVTQSNVKTTREGRHWQRRRKGASTELRSKPYTKVHTSTLTAKIRVQAPIHIPYVHEVPTPISCVRRRLKFLPQLLYARNTKVHVIAHCNYEL